MFEGGERVGVGTTDEANNGIGLGGSIFVSFVALATALCSCHCLRHCCLNNRNHTLSNGLRKPVIMQNGKDGNVYIFIYIYVDVWRCIFVYACEPNHSWTVWENHRLSKRTIVEALSPCPGWLASVRQFLNTLNSIFNPKLCRQWTPNGAEWIERLFAVHHLLDRKRQSGHWRRSPVFFEAFVRDDVQTEVSIKSRIFIVERLIFVLIWLVLMGSSRDVFMEQGWEGGVGSMVAKILLHAKKKWFESFTHHG